LKGAKKMKTKPEIKEKLEDAEKLRLKGTKSQFSYIDGVIDTIRWVLGVKITQEPKDPVTEE
jgi:glycerol-3-phosphate dehydrogenase